MNPNADRIKELVSMPDLLNVYGFTVNRAGFIACPFHEGDRTPSLRVYRGDRGWHCFGCGKGGTVIDFVKHLYHIDYRQAVVRLDNDFGLGLTTARPDRRSVQRLREARREQERQQAEQTKVQLAIVRYHRELVDIIKHEAPDGPDAAPSTRFLFALGQIEYSEELLLESLGSGKQVKDWTNLQPIPTMTL